jgi:hypothetical protein
MTKPIARRSWASPPHALILALLALPCAALGFDANGVKLGDREAAVKAAFPEAYCKPLEWQSDAADRRCDDARIVFAGVPARITFYLKGDAVQAFDVRFQKGEFESVAAKLKSRYGKPVSEGRETVRRRDKPAQEIYRVRWRKDKERATYSARPGERRSELLAWRGDFDTEIYRVK